MPSCADNKGEDSLGDFSESQSSRIWRERAVVETSSKMLRATQSLVSQTVDQLCSRNAILEKVGVTEKQLHAVLSLRLNRNTSPLFISVLIDREVRAENIIKNKLGNYIMNPNKLNPVAVECSVDQSKEIDSTATEASVDSNNQTSSLNCNKEIKEDQNKIDKSCTPSPEKVELEEVIDKPLVKKRGRRKKQPKVEEEDEEDEESYEPSASPSSQEKFEQDEDDKPLAKRRGRTKGRKSKIEDEGGDFDEEVYVGSPCSLDKVEVEEEEDAKPLIKRKGKKRGRKPKIEGDCEYLEEEGYDGSPSSQDKMEVEEEDSKPLVKKRGRKKKEPKVEREDEEEEGEESFDSSQSITLRERKPARVVVTTNNGRRIIRKITKYDPSEYYLTPLVRKKSKCVVVDQPKKRLKRGRPPLKPKIEAVASPVSKKPESIRSNSRQGKPLTEVYKGSTGKSASPEKKPQDKVGATKDKDSNDSSESELNSTFEEMAPFIPVKSKASMLKNECFICSKSADVSDECSVLACSLCLNIAHSDCVEDDGFYKNLKKWRCSQCIFNHPAVCSTCCKGYDKNDGVMVMCDYCEELFHPRCHVPQLKRPYNLTHWRCSYCPRITLADTLIGGREDLKSSVGTFAFNIIGKKLRPLIRDCLPEPVIIEEARPQLQLQLQAESALNEDQRVEPTVSESVKIKEEPVDQVQETANKPKEKEPVLPASYKYHRPGEPIPTVDEWTPHQVADYFSIRFGPAVGNAFLAQEIDGKSLKLLRRNDVTDELGLQFGIALKVLYYVKKIQLKTNVIHELWT